MGAPHLGPGSFGVSLRAPQMGAALWGPGRFESHGDPINKGPSFGSWKVWGLIETLQMGAPHLGPGSFGVSPRPPQMGAPQDGAASIEGGVSMATATPWQRRCTAWKPAGNPGNGGGEPRYLGGGQNRNLWGHSTPICGDMAPQSIGTQDPNNGATGPRCMGTQHLNLWGHSTPMFEDTAPRCMGTQHPNLWGHGTPIYGDTASQSIGTQHPNNGGTAP